MYWAALFFKKCIELVLGIGQIIVNLIVMKGCRAMKVVSEVFEDF